MTEEIPLIRDDVFRFAVGHINGRRSASWRIAFKHSDIYWAPRAIFRLRKGSVHYSDYPTHPDDFRYIGVQSEEAWRRGCPTAVEQRAQATWPGLYLGGNYFVEFLIRIPESDLRSFSPLPDDDSRKMLWLPPAPVGMATELKIVSGPPWHSGLIPTARTDGMALVPMAEFRLGNGRYVWIEHHYIPTPTHDWLESARAQVRTAILEGHADLDAIKSASARVTLAVNCGDGTFAEAEFAGDSLA